MPLMAVTLVSVAVCDVCHTSSTHLSSPESATAREGMTKAGWWFARPGDTFQDTKGNPITALCPKHANLYRTLWPTFEEPH